MSMLRKARRVGKRASKFQYTAAYQSIVVECTSKEKWRPREICVSWTRRGRRLISKLRPWQPSPDNKCRGVVIWPEPEIMEITVTLYKGPKDKSYENKEWEFAVIDVDETGKRKVLATAPINMVRYVSSLPYEHDLHLRLKPVSKKIKSVILEVSLTSEFLKEGKATDDDMMSIASMMSISNLSTIGFLEDDEDDDYSYMGGGRSISPPEVPDHVLSTDELLKWAQEITKDLPGVKITNMTTSWRSGMGFLAIIHYFRPDLMPDFDMQSPNSIKENNRNAFTLARSLGIACPLTPNMMVTTTIPDKLSVTSFLYQMYQYFTKARLSAISRAKQEEQEGKLPSGEGSQGTSPSSPFDISKFDMFATSNISPVTTPPPRTDRVMQYSRHSKENLRRQSTSEIESPSDPVDGSQAVFFIDPSTQVRRHSTPTLQLGKEVGVVDPPVSPRTAAKFRLDQVITEHAQSVTESGETAGVSGFEKDRELEFENMNTDTESSKSSTSLLQEEKSAVSELPSEIKPVDASADASMSSEGHSIYKYTPGQGTKKSEKPGGRKLPPVPSYTSSPKITRKREEIRKQAKELLKIHKLDKLDYSQRNVSTDTENSSVYRKRAIEMLGEVFNSPSSSTTNLNSEDLVSEGSATSLGMTEDDLSASRSADSLLPSRKLSKQRLSDSALLSTTRMSQNGKPTSLVNSSAAVAETALDSNKKSSRGSESSSRTSKGVEGGRSAGQTVSEPKKKVSRGSEPRSGRSSVSAMEEGLESKRKSSRGSDGGTVSRRRNSLPDIEGSLEVGVPELGKKSSESSSPKKQLPDSSIKGGRGPGRGAGTGAAASSGEGTGVNQRRMTTDLKRQSDSKLPRQDAPVSPDAPVGRLRSATTGHISRISNSRPSSAAGAGSSARKKITKPAPVARPISAQPSRAVQKRLEEEEKAKEEKERQEREKEEREKAAAIAAATAAATAAAEKSMKKQGSQTDGLGGAEGQAVREMTRGEREGLSLKDTVGIPSANGTPKHKKSLPSPSAWSQHSEDISQDLLVTQSEYVKTELLSLQAQTQDLENRAKDIEMNIRVAMSEGNKESEEELMQEWFGLLNKKNELIKRQIELNIIEKEEDLEKRQFFLNRELRPLMEIPEDEKSGEQKAREEHLLRELFELIDERDKLERKKMTNMKNAHHERAGLALAQAKSADIVNRPQGHMTRQGSKDCVIS